MILIEKRTGDQILKIIQELIDERNACRAQRDHFQTLLKHETKEHNEARVENERLRQSIQAEVRIVDDRTKLQEEIADLRERCDFREMERDEAQEALAHLRDILANAGIGSIEVCNAANSGKTSNVSFQMGDCNAGKQETADQIVREASGRFRRAPSATEVQMMRNEIDKLHKANEELRSELAYWKGYGDVVLRPQLNASNDKVSELTAEVERLKRVNDNWQGAHAELSEKFKKAEKECGQLAERLETWKTAYERKVQERDAMKSSLDVARAQRDAYEKQLIQAREFGQ